MYAELCFTGSNTGVALHVNVVQDIAEKDAVVSNC